MQMKIVRMALALCGMTMMTQAAVISKANNTDALNVGTSWVNGVAPGVNDVAQWDSTVTAANTVVLGADLSWAGAKILNPGGNVQINAGNTLTLGASGVDMTSATKAFTLYCPLVVAADQTWMTGSQQFSPWGPVDLGAHQITLVPGAKIQFKNTISGAGTIVVSAGGNQTQFSSGTTAANATVAVNTGGTLVFDTASGPVTGIRAQNAKLNGGTLSVSANTGANTIDYVANALTINSRLSTLTLTSAINRNTQLRAGSYVRNPGALAIFAGLNLGLNPIASATTNSTSIWFDNPPALLGGGGGLGTTTNSVLVGVLADTTAGGTGMGFATYDASYGVRLLNPLTECIATLIDGQTQLDNVRLTNAVSTVFTNTLNSATTINSLSFRIDAGAQTNCGIRINGAGPLILNSGAIVGTISATSIVITNSFFLDVGTLDLNGQEGVFSSLGTGTQGSSSHGGAVLDLSCSITNDGGKGLTISGSVVKFSGSATNRYTGDTRCNSGFLWLVKTGGTTLGGNLVVNGGQVQNNGNQVDDNCDIFVTGGYLNQRSGAANSGSGASETFRDLYLTGGSYDSGASGTSSGSTTLSNAVVAGGTWNVTKGHVATMRGRLTLSGGVINFSGSTDSSAGGRLTLNGELNITNTASGVYTCMTLNSANNTANSARLFLTNDVTFVGHALNTNTTVIAAPAGSKQGMILFNGTRTFTIDDGPASVDLLLEPIIANNGVLVSGLTKMGAGTLALATTNLYTGATAVSNGTLVVNGSVVSPVTVSSGATFAGTGIVQVVSGTALVVNTNGVVNPGTVAGTVGTLSVTGNVTCASASVFHVDISGSSADCLVASGNVSGGSVVVDVSRTGADKGPWVIMRANQINGSYTVRGDKLIASISPNGTELVLRKNDGTLISFQ